MSMLAQNTTEDREEIEKIIRDNASALICPKCGGGGTGAYKGEGTRRCRECNGEGLVDWNYGDAPEKIIALISQAEARGREEERKDKMLELAEAQLLGFTYGRMNAYGIGGLVSEMGLTKSEWKQLQKKFDMVYLTKQDRQDIEEELK